MKKVLIATAALLLAGATVHAQSILSSIFGNKNASETASTNTLGSTLGNILGGLAGTVYSAPVSLDGTYTYNGSAISVSSTQGGVVSNLAGTAVSSAIEGKVDEKLAKFGIKPGSMTVTFNNTDNTFTWTVFGIPLNGTYKVGDGENTVTLTFGKAIQYLCMTGTLKSTSTGAEMLFPSKKTLTFLKKVIAKAGQSNSNVAAIANAADGYDDLKIGFKLVK